jgi:uncharacterized Zn-finger protein
MQEQIIDPALDMAGVTPPSPVTEARVVTAKDLPLSCPLPGEEVWNMHPRVYLPIDDEPSGELTCPYCGTRYRLQRG